MLVDLSDSLAANAVHLTRVTCKACLIKFLILAEAGVSARGDLNPANGTYEVPGIAMLNALTC